MKILTLFLGLGFFAPAAYGFDYALDASGGSLSLTDSETDIGGLKTLHTDAAVSVTISDLAWSALENATSTDTIITYSTMVDGVVQATGTYDLSGDGKTLPSSLDVGQVTADSNGLRVISVELTLDGVTTGTESSYETFAVGASIMPLVVILLFAIVTQIVELSMIMGIFVGACMAAGSMKDGFFATLDTYIVNSLADDGHAFVYLFTFFLSGTVGMMEKSGGFKGFSTMMSRFATSPRTGQVITYFSGLAVFFDDYANALIVGESMRPITDLLSISREKLAFLVDATAAPVASIVPLTSWIGYEVGLIQDELDNIYAKYPADEIDISDNGLSVFLQSVKYRYYPFFMLFLIPTLVATKRDYGPMLIAERKTQVYDVKDGGEGGMSKGKSVANKPNQPEPDTPQRVWNFFVPLGILIILVIHLLVQSGEDPDVKQTLIDKLEASDSYVALLYGSMGTGLLSMIFYHLQFKKGGDSGILWPTPMVLKDYIVGLSRKDSEENPRVKPLMSIHESVSAFLRGMEHVFGAIVVLTLAWACADIMKVVGTDRLFAQVITGSLEEGALPTISFVISFLMALATGTSWGTMGIMFPLMVQPTYQVSDGDKEIVYSTIAGILSGAVAGDHVSPISDTTVLSSLAADCNLLRHVATQSPYVIFVSLISIIIGTIPVGYSDFPNIIAFILGYLLILAFTFGICRPVISKTGAFDPLTELYMKLKGDPELLKIKEDTAEKFAMMGLPSSGFKFWSKGEKMDQDGVEKEVPKEEAAVEDDGVMAEVDAEG